MIECTTNEYKDKYEEIAITEIAILSAKRILSQMRIPLKEMIRLDVIIRGICTQLWTIIPISLDENSPHRHLLNNQIEQIEISMKIYLEQIKIMAGIK